MSLVSLLWIPCGGVMGSVAGLAANWIAHRLRDAGDARLRAAGLPLPRCTPPLYPLTLGGWGMAAGGGAAVAGAPLSLHVLALVAALLVPAVGVVTVYEWLALRRVTRMAEAARAHGPRNLFSARSLSVSTPARRARARRGQPPGRSLPPAQ